jgi:hypothetical protein
MLKPRHRTTNDPANRAAAENKARLGRLVDAMGIA